MATESDLRDLLRDPDPDGGGGIDLDAVLTRAHRRRRPRVVAARALGATALVGALFTTVLVTVPSLEQPTGMLAEDARTDGAAPFADGSASSLAIGASRIAYCGAPLPEVAPAENGLVLQIAAVEGSSNATRIPVQVLVRNTSAQRVTGTTGSTPIVAFSQGGVVLWHDAGPWDVGGVVVDLAPGEALAFETALEPVVCTPDDEVEGFQRSLPAAGPGTYDVSAALDFIPADESMGGLVVTGPTAPVVLR